MVTQFCPVVFIKVRLMVTRFIKVRLRLRSL